MALLEEHLLDDFLPELVVQPEVDADDDAGDDHDDRALDHLVLPGPFDLLQLRPRLLDEVGPALDLAGGPDRRRRRGPAAPEIGLPRHYLVSRGGVCLRTRGQT